MRSSEYMAAMSVTVPEGTSGDVALERFEITESGARLHNLREMIHGSGRPVSPGTYTRLTRRGALWMTDTEAERYDLIDFVLTVDHMGLEHVLINGLGLGMVVHALVHAPSVKRIDICEIDPDVIALVGPHVEALGAEHGIEVRVRQGDAHDPDAVWGSAERWDAAWHDIWAEIDADDYDDHKAMRRRYAHRAAHQEVWMADEVRRLRRYEYRYIG